jgi:hypothetical protein
MPTASFITSKGWHGFNAISVNPPFDDALVIQHLAYIQNTERARPATAMLGLKYHAV